MSETSGGENFESPRLGRDAEARLRSFAEAFSRDGAVRIPAALNAEDISVAQQLYDWSYAHPGQAAQQLTVNARGESFFVDSLNASAAARGHYRDVLRLSRLPAIVAAVLGVDQLYFMGEQIFMKRGAANTAGTFWHQDEIPMDGFGAVGMWITFDRLDAEHSLQFVRGTHRGKLFNAVIPSESGGESTLLFPDAVDMEPFPDIEADPGRFDIISWPNEPGDIVLFHTLTMHGGGPVPPEGMRRTLSLRFVQPQTRFKPLPRRELNGNLGAEATNFLWEGYEEGEPMHSGKHFVKVFDAGKAAL